MITITIEKLSILINDQEPAPEKKLNGHPLPEAEKLDLEEKVQAPGSEWIMPKPDNMASIKKKFAAAAKNRAPGAKKPANKIKKVAADVSKNETTIPKIEKKPFIRERTPDEEKQVKAIQNKRWRLKNNKKLTPDHEAELNKILAEIEENRKKPYTFS